jgi:hypothetical protein
MSSLYYESPAFWDDIEKAYVEMLLEQERDELELDRQGAFSRDVPNETTDKPPRDAAQSLFGPANGHTDILDNIRADVAAALTLSNEPVTEEEQAAFESLVVQRAVQNPRLPRTVRGTEPKDAFKTTTATPRSEYL